MKQSISWMMHRSKILGLTILMASSSLALSTSTSADTENTRRLAKDEPSPPAKASDMDWLAGYWRGTGLGGECEESWVPASAGSMMGTFRLLKDGKTVFYEFMLLAERDDSLVLRVKHFNEDMTAWEEKADSVDFRLVELGKNVAYFNGLTFKRNGDSLKIYLAMRSKGELREEAFDFALVR